jgi:crossover junction endodeoxyribonuclease RuvC
LRYVGIDPSTKTGLVVLENDGTICFEVELYPEIEEEPQRFMNLAEQVITYLGKQGDFVICIEGFSYGSKGQGVSTQYGIGWLIRAELIRNRYSYTEVSPSAVKKFATGKGNEKKENMVLPIYKHWGFEHPSDNVRDAYVLAQIAKGINGVNKMTKYQTDVIKKIQEGN